MANDSGGSNSSTPPPAGSNPGGEGAGNNSNAKMTFDQMAARNVDLERKLKETQGLLTNVTLQLDEANKILAGQEKQRLIARILPRCTCTGDDLAEKSIEELKAMDMTLDVAIPPKDNAIHFRSRQDLSDRERSLTVGDQSVVTALKRKQLDGR